MRAAFLDAGRCKSLLQILVNSRRTQCCFDPLPSVQNRSWKPGIVKCESLHDFRRNDAENFAFQQRERQRDSTAQKTAREGHCNDTLLSSSVALSADSQSNYLFISDTYRHRVIIADGSGKILDCIGSSPGMLDGTFEMAELRSPAATLFDPRQRLLYIADSENHAIRRADLTERTVVTVYPPTLKEEKLPVWKRLFGWMGSGNSHVSDRKDDTSENSNVLRYPWHMKATEVESLLVASRRFENIWVLDITSGMITNFQSPGCDARWEEFMAEEVLLEDMEHVNSLLLQETKKQNAETEISRQNLSPLDIISRAVRVENMLVFVGTDGILRKYDFTTQTIGDLQLFNLGRLGLPSWWSLRSPNYERTGCAVIGDSLERSTGQDGDSYRINVQPGRRLLCICPVFQSGTILAAPLEEGSICRQARGSVVELSMFGGSLISRKVSSAQQWLDDLDDFEDSDPETEDVGIPERSSEDNTIYCLVDTSLGVGEVVIDAVLYLKSSSSEGCPPLRKNPSCSESSKRQIYLRHLHVRIHLQVASTFASDKINRINVQV